MNTVHVYDDRLVHSIIPIGSNVEITGFSTDYVAQIEAMTPEQRLEMFSRKKSGFNVGADSAQA